MTEHGNDTVQVQRGFVNDKHAREERMFILYVHCEERSPPSVPRLSAALLSAARASGQADSRVLFMAAFPTR